MSVNAHAKTGRIYLVHWPDNFIVKVGSTTGVHRWKAFLRRGAELSYLCEITDRDVRIAEADLHADIRARGFLPAFTCKADAEPFLGNGGAGWTECYRVGVPRLAQLQAIDELAAARARRGA